MRALTVRVYLMVAVLLATPLVASSQTLTAVWDPNPASDNVASYEVCIGTTSLSCNFKDVTVPASQTTHTFIPNPGVLYRVAVRAISAAGPGAYSPEVSVSVPSLAVPANRTSTVNVPITPLTLSASDPDGGTLQFTHTGLPFGLTLNQSTGVISGTPTSTGTYSVTVFVNDGLATASAAFVWTIQSGSSDMTAPTVAITSHTANQTVTSANVTLSGTATDSGSGGSGITSVTVNGVAATGGAASGSDTANWSRALTLVGGANLLTVVATDGAGNARTSTITLNLSIPDTTAPTLSITSHTNNQIVSAASITLAGTATDSGAGGSGINSVTVNGVAAAGGTASGSNTSNWSSTVALASGANVLTVIATDGAGNARQSQITLKRDSAAPALAITSHTSGQTVTTSSITLSGTASDSATGGNGITSVLVNGASATGGTASGTGTANWSRSVSLAAGLNTITVVARDAAGNTTTVFLNVTYTVPDTTAPSLTISSHTSGQTVTTASITLSGTATDNGAGGSGITSVTVNGATVTGGTATGTATANWSGAVTLVSGTNTLTVVARDGAGNARTRTLSLTYTPIAVVTAVSATPNAGSIASQIFALQYSDTLGATDLSQAWVLFNTTTASSVNSCLVYYDRVAGTLNLVNDAATQWLTTPMASGGALQNSQCAVSSAGSSVTTSGNTLNLNVAVTFKPAFAGTKNIYMFGRNAKDVNSGWQTRGGWTVPGTSVTTITADSATPNAGSGSSAAQTFTMNYSDTLGATDISQAWVWFNATTASSANSCLVYYDRVAGTMNLVNDAATQWMVSPLTSGGTLQNSQCAVSLAGSSVTTSGNTLALNLAVTFNPAFAGTKNIYMFGRNAKDVNSGWQTRGTWTVSAAGAPVVTVGDATPNVGAGAMQTFVLPYSDSAGATDLSTLWVWFNASFTPTSPNNSCMLFYDRAAARLYFLNDAGTAWMAGTLGSAGTLQNSQCSVNLAASSVTVSGTTLTLNLAMGFKPAYAGAKNVYLYGQNAAGVTSGWQLRGSWTVQ